MTSLPHDEIIPFQKSGRTKKEQVTEMFDTIAGRYDFMNRFLSARFDVSWRKKAIKMLAPYQPQRILDIATGTGDMAIMAYKILHPEHITGIDISKQMLEIGKEKVLKNNLADYITLQQGDSENLQFENNYYDASMAAFGVRNFENLEKGLAEIYRVIKPGGRLLIIEFSRPKGFMKFLYKAYMEKIAPSIARLFSQNKEAYQYLNKSAHAFPERKDFTSILEKTGFVDTRYQALTFGICCIYTAMKPVH